MYREVDRVFVGLVLTEELSEEGSSSLDGDDEESLCLLVESPCMSDF